MIRVEYVDKDNDKYPGKAYCNVLSGGERDIVLKETAALLAAMDRKYDGFIDEMLDMFKSDEKIVVEDPPKDMPSFEEERKEVFRREREMQKKWRNAHKPRKPRRK